MAESAPNLQTRLQVFDLLDRLEALTASATKLPLTRRAVVNPAELQEVAARLRHLLPKEIVEAQQIIRYKDSLVQRAQVDAKRMRDAAEQEARHKISETQIMHDARREADELAAGARRRADETVAGSEAQARQRIEGADAYAMDVLRKLDEELTALLASARRGMEVLESGSHLDQGEGRPAGREVRDGGRERRPRRPARER